MHFAFPDTVTARDCAELVDIAAEIGRTKDGTSRAVLQRLLVARMAQLGVRVVDPADDEEDLAAASTPDLSPVTPGEARDPDAKRARAALAKVLAR